MIQKPVCPTCCRYYIEGMPNGNKYPTESGREHVADWKPYKLWVGDLWRCEGCKNHIIIGALRPAAEHYMPNFDEEVARYAPHLMVCDC